MNGFLELQVYLEVANWMFARFVMPTRPIALNAMSSFAQRLSPPHFLNVALALCFATHALALKETPFGRFDVSASLSTEYDSRIFGISSQMYNQILDSNTTNPIYALNEIESEAILSMESHLADETNDTKDETTQDFLVSK